MGDDSPQFKSRHKQFKTLSHQLQEIIDTHSVKDHKRNQPVVKRPDYDSNFTGWLLNSPRNIPRSNPPIPRDKHREVCRRQFADLRKRAEAKIKTIDQRSRGCRNLRTKRTSAFMRLARAKAHCSSRRKRLCIVIIVAIDQSRTSSNGGRRRVISTIGTIATRSHAQSRLRRRSTRNVTLAQKIDKIKWLRNVTLAQIAFPYVPGFPVPREDPIGQQ